MKITKFQFDDIKSNRKIVSYWLQNADSVLAITKKLPGKLDREDFLESTLTAL